MLECHFDYRASALGLFFVVVVDVYVDDDSPFGVPKITVNRNVLDSPSLLLGNNRNFGAQCWEMCDIHMRIYRVDKRGFDSGWH